MAVDYCGTPTVMEWCDMGRRLKAYMNGNLILKNIFCYKKLKNSEKIERNLKKNLQKIQNSKISKKI